MLRAMILTIALTMASILTVPPEAARAQDAAWIQVEAQPDIRTARQRARLFARSFDNVRAFRTPTGWYAIAIGPFDAGSAAIGLAQFVNDGRIPDDAFLADGSTFLAQIWPVDQNAGASGFEIAASGVSGAGISAETETTSTEPTTEATTETALAGPSTDVLPDAPDETPSEARRLEASLSRELKMDIQRALAWTGDYDAGIDGAFGSGTRRAVSQYQERNAFDATGYLTTRQINSLIGRYAAFNDMLGFEDFIDDAAGIQLKMPRAMVQFARYAAPFVHYDPKAGQKVRVLLISQEGSREGLASLYDIMASLEIVPLEGYRQLKRDWFVLSGKDDDLVSYTYAKYDDGTIKGFTMIWPPEMDADMRRAADIMFRSFQTLGGALDPTLGASAESIDLVAGLEVRRPDISASGFYVDGTGTVLTEASAVGQCKRVTIDNQHPASVSLIDPAIGLAVLRPDAPLAPMSYAQLDASPARLRDQILVSGYSFSGRLGAPTQSFGTLEENSGLAGEAEVARLSVHVEDGDAGGPVLARNGTLVGLLQQWQGGSRNLPADVRYALKSDQIAAKLSASGVTLSYATETAPVRPERLIRLANEMTVLVSCWN